MAATKEEIAQVEKIADTGRVESPSTEPVADPRPIETPRCVFREWHLEDKVFRDLNDRSPSAALNLLIDVSGPAEVTSQAVKDRLERAGAAAIAELNAVRDRFTTSEQWRKLKQLEDRLARERETIDQAEQASQDALAKARALLADDQDPAKEEARYRKARDTKSIHENRAIALGGLVSTARGDAEAALIEALQARQRELLSTATAKSNARKAQVADVLADCLPELLDSDGAITALSGYRTFGFGRETVDLPPRVATTLPPG